MNLQSKWNTGALLLACALAGAGAAHAQVYKWKDAKGVTHFSDTPPPAATAKVEVKSYGGDGGSAPALPYELAEAARNHPVTLYTAGQCDACDQGRAMLRARGIPYAEKTVSGAADQAVLKQVGGSTQLPLLLVGRQTITGYEQGAWDGALNAAAYPAERKLPADYRQAPATPAAPKPERVDPKAQAAAAAAAAAEQARREQLPEVKPAGDFQF